MRYQAPGSLWLFLLTIAVIVVGAIGFLIRPRVAQAAPQPSSSGSLDVLGKDGKILASCPLKHTEVRAAISGFLSRVTVTQIFENNAQSAIEAVYTFPLPQDAAVDDMTIRIGDRTVKGLIKRREEARAIYENAKRTGHAAALLDQERPNIFTQSVANILPGEQVAVTISYFDTLRYDEGSYEFVFPMVVGPRYIPGEPEGKRGGGWSPDTGQVPDASRITPPITPPGTRAGHDISIDLSIDAGVPIQDLRSASHQVDVDRTGAASAHIQLRDLAAIPNKDFILKYDVAGKEISDALLSTTAPSGSAASGGYFTLILQPPARVPAADVTPKELVFVVDTSGSMMGFPIEQAKKLISRALDELYPGDTFNIITFSGDTEILFKEPVYPTAENIRLAKKFLVSRSGSGGTEMMKAIRAALDPSDKQDHIRVVCFATDGYVGNDMEIIGEIQKHANARVFSFGIGNSVNRFLLDGMAKAGRGAVEYVTLQDKADQAATRLYERLRSPLLTDVSIDWAGLPVTDVYPARLPDLFSGQPLVITGRYASAQPGTIRLLGKRAGDSFTREIPVSFSSDGSAHAVIAPFWARKKIDDLMSQDWAGAQRGTPEPEIEKQVTQLGLDYRLMTQYTSFVAVEERVVTKDGKPVRIEVPVEMPEGVRYEGIFGDPYRLSAVPMSALAFSSAQKSMIATSSVSSTLAMPQGVVGRRSVTAGGVRAKQALPPAPAKPGLADKPDAEEATLSPERARLESKLDPTVLAAFDCWQKSPSACTTVHNGKIELQIMLADDSVKVLDAIKALGFDIRTTKPNVLTGLLPIENLEALAHMNEVRFVSTVRR